MSWFTRFLGIDRAPRADDDEPHEAQTLDFLHAETTRSEREADRIRAIRQAVETGNLATDTVFRRQGNRP